MDNRNKQKFALLCLVCYLVGAYFYTTIKKKVKIQTLNKCARYTLARVDDFYTKQLRTTVRYQYQVGNQTFLQKVRKAWTSDLGKPGPDEPGKFAQRRVFVEVYCDDPNVHRVHWNISVPDTVKAVPVGGWSQKPVWAKPRDWSDEVTTKEP